MEQIDYAGMANFISDNLRLKTFPLSVKFLKTAEEFPEKTRQPSITLKKKDYHLSGCHPGPCIWVDCRVDQRRPDMRSSHDCLRF